MTVIIIITPHPTTGNSVTKTPKVYTLGKMVFTQITDVVRAVQTKYLVSAPTPTATPAPAVQTPPAEPK